MNEYREYYLRYCVNDGYGATWHERNVKYWDRDSLEKAYWTLTHETSFVKNVRKFQLDIKEMEL